MGTESSNPTYHAPYAVLYDALPDTLRTFSFRGPANAKMLGELDKWVERARDRAWLPSLRRVAFKLSLPNVIREWRLMPAQECGLDSKMLDFVEALGQRDVPVVIGEPRKVADLEYPVSV